MYTTCAAGFLFIGYDEPSAAIPSFVTWAGSHFWRVFTACVSRFGTRADAALFRSTRWIGTMRVIEILFWTDANLSCRQLSDNHRLRYLLSVAGSPPSIVKKGPEYPRPARVLQLAKRLGLDLADALASDGERVAYFL
jgi:hypothetical protein